MSWVYNRLAVAAQEVKAAETDVTMALDLLDKACRDREWDTAIDLRKRVRAARFRVKESQQLLWDLER